MDTQSRQPQGTAAGGQFAAARHAESTIVLVSDDAPEELPDWGSGLDAWIDEKIGELAEDLTEGTESREMPELLGCSEDDLVAKYGPSRGGWLAGLTIEVEAETIQTYRQTLESPAEYETRGEASIYDSRARRTIAETEFVEDLPDLDFYVRQCPVDEQGAERLNLRDPKWREVTVASRWRACGFLEPETAIAWQQAGATPREASGWEYQGFTPEQAKQYIDNGETIAAALRDRREAAAVAEDESTVGTPVRYAPHPDSGVA